MRSKRIGTSSRVRSLSIGLRCLVVATLVIVSGLQGCASEETQQESRENAQFVMAVAQMGLDVYAIRRLPSVLEIAEYAGSPETAASRDLRELGYTMVYDIKTCLASASGNLAEWRQDAHPDRAPIVDSIDRALKQLEDAEDAVLASLRAPSHEMLAAGKASLSGGRRELMRAVLKIRVRSPGSRGHVRFPEHSLMLLSDDRRSAYDYINSVVSPVVTDYMADFGDSCEVEDLPSELLALLGLQAALSEEYQSAAESQ